ncbi:phosphoadenosine phosphosulfate reductase family protein [Pokkaliibacter plantistimulans]|nr:phosphoadenosine phosphosulfate reductase family protein [Pokkaliibacter plantistimulans]
MNKLNSAVDIVRQYYINDDRPWIIGFSGGKDSSLVVKLFLLAIKDLKIQKKDVYIYYCDTGVEIPVLNGYIEKVLGDIQEEGREFGINVLVEAIKPKLEDRYFVKLIGRGYPPPSNKFRWCTDRLRINPIQESIKKYLKSEEVVVLLGTRYEESLERDKILNKNHIDKYIYRQEGYSRTTLFCPIVDFNIDDVWDGLSEYSDVKSIDIHAISKIYKNISGECPIIRMPDDSPCSKGRFGCWTCTVIRKDKATQNLILNGHVSLIPLLEFRDWLLSVRDNPAYRCSVRRNGARSLGPFRLSGRQVILDRLLYAQKMSGHELISKDEIIEIRRLWELDRISSKYRED